MASELINVWVDPILFKNIATALRMGEDSEYLITALNVSYALKIMPTVRNLANGYHEDYGVVKVEIWKEGLVFWSGGEIRWKSWEVAEDASQRQINEAVWTYLWPTLSEIQRIAPMDIVLMLDKAGLKIVRK